MKSIIVSLAIIGVTILMMCVVYKQVTGGNFLKDLIRDIFAKG